MKKTIIFLILSFLLIPRIGFATYLIELTNGSTYLTDHYWDEDGKIRFLHFGGIIGFSKNTIRKITETDQEYIDPTQFQKAPPVDKNNDTQPASATTDKLVKTGGNEDPEKKTEEKPVDLSIYKEKKNELMQKYTEAQNKLSQTIKIRDRVAQQEAAREISRIERERAKTAKEIREKNNGVLPSWWQQGDKEEE